MVTHWYSILATPTNTELREHFDTVGVKDQDDFTELNGATRVVPQTRRRAATDGLPQLRTLGRLSGRRWQLGTLTENLYGQRGSHSLSKIREVKTAALVDPGRLLYG
jgi:hypothetical protein